MEPNAGKVDDDLDNKTPPSDDKSSDHEIESKAREMGWRPKEEFKGDPEKWVDAATYYKRGIEVLPIVKAEAASLRAELARVKQQANDYAQVVERAAQREIDDLKRQLKDAQEVRKAAVKEGDGEAFEASEAEIKDLEGKIAQASTSTKPSPDNDLKARWDTWLSENQWFVQDPELQALANSIAIGNDPEVRALAGKNAGEEFWNLVGRKAKALKARMDGADDGRSRPGPSRGTHGNPGPTPARRSYENLDPEFKKTCDRMYKDFGAKGTLEKWRERYVSQCSDDAFRS